MSETLPPITKELREELRAEWVKALRSGEFQQCQGQLSSGGGFCCLGVAAELVHRRFPEVLPVAALSSEDGELEWRDYGPETYCLPPVAQAALGLLDDCGDFGDGRSLANLNDQGKTFSEIADVIESRPPGLFVDDEGEVRP